jgi:hypothetical protein
MKKRWPQINFEGVAWGIFEPDGGYLDARASCQAVVDAFVASGGTYRQLAVLDQPEADRLDLDQSKIDQPEINQPEIGNPHVGTAASAVWSSEARQLADALQNSRLRTLSLFDS